MEDINKIDLLLAFLFTLTFIVVSFLIISLLYFLFFRKGRTFREILGIRKTGRLTPPNLSKRFWLFYSAGFLIVGGLITLFYGFRRGIGGDVERDISLRLFVGGSWLAYGAFILILYCAAKKKRQ